MQFRFPTAMLLILSLLMQAGGVFAAVLPCGTGTGGHVGVASFEQHLGHFQAEQLLQHPESHHQLMVHDTDQSAAAHSPDCCDGMKSGPCAGAGCATATTAIIVSTQVPPILAPEDPGVLPRRDAPSHAGPPASIFRPPIA